jgi:hypothetical protein
VPDVTRTRTSTQLFLGVAADHDATSWVSPYPGDAHGAVQVPTSYLVPWYVRCRDASPSTSAPCLIRTPARSPVRNAAPPSHREYVTSRSDETAEDAAEGPAGTHSSVVRTARSSSRRTPTTLGHFLHIRLTKRGEQWLLTVDDNGIGIDPQYAERIFTIFQRLHLRDEYGGTGIGLALCRKIVDFHKGRIWLAEKAEPVARFQLTLPVSQAPMDAVDDDEPALRAAP